MFVYCLTVCCGLTWQAAKHHTAVLLTLLQKDRENNRKKSKTYGLRLREFNRTENKGKIQIQNTAQYHLLRKKINSTPAEIRILRYMLGPGWER